MWFFKKKNSNEKSKSHYLSAKEMREIAKKNARTIRELERKKKRIASEDEYLTEMRNDNNIVEFDGLCTYFFGDAGVVKAVDGVSFDIP
jgi:peptide/nickel transport system ATP-binding protein